MVDNGHVGDRGTKTICVIEDDPTISELLRAVLEDEGYRVLEPNGEPRAFDFIRQAQPDLIILDLVLEGEDGPRLLDELKRDPDTAAIPIIVCSAAVQTLHQTEERFRGSGFAVVAKPFDIAELLETIKRLLLPS